MANSIYQKYMWLVCVLEQSRGLTYEEIHEKWERCSLNFDGNELSKRTFHNWVNAIGSTLGILIECSDRAPYRYRISNRKALKDNLMKWAMNAFSIGQMASENLSIKDRILLEDIPSADDKLRIILQAMRNNHRIWMSYKAFNKEHEYDFVTDPYVVKLSRNRWYVVCHSDEHSREFIYSLDRIIEVQETEETFAVRKNYSPKIQFNGCIGITSLECIPVTEVRLRISGYLQDYIETLPLHFSQKLIEKTDDHTVYSYRLRPDCELINTLCGLGPCCEVLLPKELRKRVHDNAIETARVNDVFENEKAGNK